MNIFTLRDKVFTAWSQDVIGMSLAECMQYVRENVLSQINKEDHIVIWRENTRVAEVTSCWEWVALAWRDRVDDGCSEEIIRAGHEEF